MGSFWEELKDAFKTKSQRDEERSEGLKDALEQEQDLVGQLEQLESEYQAYLDSQKEEIDLDALFPPTLGLEKIEELKKLVTCPFSVMGGIKEHHLKLLSAKGFKHIAMVTEITQSPDVKAKVKNLRSIIKDNYHE